MDAVGRRFAEESRAPSRSGCRFYAGSVAVQTAPAYRMPGSAWAARCKSRVFTTEIGRSAAACRLDARLRSPRRSASRCGVQPSRRMASRKQSGAGLLMLDVGAREYAVHGAVRPFARLGGDCCVRWRTCIYRCRADCPEPCLIRTCQVSARRTRGCRTRAPRPLSRGRRSPGGASRCRCWPGCPSIRSIRGRPAPGTACRTPTAGG